MPPTTPPTTPPATPPTTPAAEPGVMNLWVVVPAFDEERSIGATLHRLAAQTDPGFTLAVVDNGSRDGTAAAVRAFAEEHPAMDVRIVPEPEKGTGAAADTGFRHAITAGATHIARTDADCLPAPGWIAAVKRAFADGLEMVSGPLRPRTDEFPLKLWERRLLPAVIGIAATFGRFRPGNQDPLYLGPYVMMPGCNVAITADLYKRAGGFPRTRIEDVHEDRALVNRVRYLTDAYGLRKDVAVYGSVRRLRAFGLVKTLGWYADHRYMPEVVDIR
ncbi:glycosyltransferase [Actinomadura sp. RB99]|uniref:glycosyltransferase family 2 protein n=1 Tax=Actinomadura sp. RB99 TaxID=2691577 RepID=UPI001F511F74|nr:glycosyltransferase [Actinomadura sp. RB99]